MAKLYIPIALSVSFMVSCYRITGLGVLVAFIILAFTFATSLLAAGVENYNLAVSGAFIMGGLMSICLSAVFKMYPFSGKKSGDGGTDEK